MREFITRLDVSDGSAASALRVIDHFDHLVEQRSSRAALLRAAAALARRPAGFHDADGTVQRFDTEGGALHGSGTEAGESVPVPGQPDCRVWLEQPGEYGPLDALILERCALAIGTLMSSTSGATTVAPSREALVHLVLTSEAPENQRLQAAAHLALSGPLTVWVSASPVPGARLSTRMGPHTVTILPGLRQRVNASVAGTATAVAPADLPTALSNALVALRVAAPESEGGPAVVVYEQLGVWGEVLRRFSPEEAAELPEVSALEELRSNHPWVVGTLQAVVEAPSVRRAAEEVHVHHSTLQERLAWLGSRLEWDLTTPAGKARAALVLLLWRSSQRG